VFEHYLPKLKFTKLFLGFVTEYAYFYMHASPEALGAIG